MQMNRYKPEQIVTMLRQIEVDSCLCFSTLFVILFGSGLNKTEQAVRLVSDACGEK